MGEVIEHPIQFSPAMVVAILEGRKTQTRRVISPKEKPKVEIDRIIHGDWPIGHHLVAAPGLHAPKLNPHGAVAIDIGHGELLGLKPDEFSWVTRYGKVGQGLWVKETSRYVQYSGHATIENPRIGEMNGGHKHFLWSLGSLDVPHPFWQWRMKYGANMCPAIFMPRWCSRIDLKIADLRRQRLQNISEADAIAEGAAPWQFGNDQCLTTGERGADSPYRGGYACLWDEINGDRGYTWKSNPWVWAITFEVAMMKK